MRPAGRNAMTLVETMVFGMIGLMIFGILAGFYRSGGRVFELTGREASATADARLVCESLFADLRACYCIEEPKTVADWARDHRLVLDRFAGEDVQARVTKNLVGAGHKEYPNDADSGHTEQFIDVQRITYALEGKFGTSDGARLVRRSAGGYLKLTFDAGAPEPRPPEFIPDNRVRVRDPGPTLLAADVVSCEIAPLVVDMTPDARGLRKIVAAGTGATEEERAANSVAHTALVVLQYAADRSAPGITTPEGKVAFATKFWLERQSLALRFPGSFSSVDDQLSF